MNQLDYRLAVKYTQQHTKCQPVPLFELRPCIMGREKKPQDEVIKVVLNEVYLHYGFTLAQLATKGRKHELVKARQIAMNLLRKYTNLPLTAVGNMFGGYDHTSVLHSQKVVETYKDTEPEYAHELAIVEQSIKYKI